MPTEKEALTVSAASTQFTMDLYKHVAKEHKNVFFCPLSIHAVLSLCFQGAANRTFDLLSRALYLPDKSAAAEGYNIIMNFLNELEDVELLMANKAYFAENCKVQPSFREIAKSKLLTEIENINFGRSEEAARDINTWASNKTQGKIPELFTPDQITSDICSILLNAIYFKAEWDTKFSPKMTRNGYFYLDEDAWVDCRMMNHVTSYKMQSLEDLDARSLEMPYVSPSVSMYIILPNRKTGLIELVSKLTLDHLNKIFTGESTEEIVGLYMPKFKRESSLELKKALKELNLGELFKSCDFSEMLEPVGSTYISRVFQKAYIDVTETGTEAAAVSVVVVKKRCGVRNATKPDIEFRVDRPFLFYIVSRKNQAYQILFCGKIVNPTSQA